MGVFKSFLSFIVLIIFLSCSQGQAELREKSKAEIATAEKDFEKMAAEKGIAEAFAFFADTNATIKRQSDTLIKGKENIRQYYSTDFFKTASVKWSPDFIDASASGDMGYTYGKFTWQSKDSAGKTEEFHGVFHTVWKKQNDGSWKYVWD